MRAFPAFVVCAACSFQHGLATSNDGGADGATGELIDAPASDAALPDAPFATGPFDTPVKVAISRADTRDDDVTLTGDMLEMYFESDRVSPGQSDIYMSRRDSISDPWSEPVRVDELSSPFLETSMEISTDGLTLYFSSNRPPSMTVDVFVATRADRNARWSAPVLVSALSSSSSNDYNAQPWTSTVLFMTSDRMPAGGGSDVFRATRSSNTAAWSTPTAVPGLDTHDYEGEAFADATGVVWFTGDAAGDDDLWRAEPNGDGTYKTPQLVTEIDTPYAENDAWLSSDGHTLYFTSDRDGSLDIYMATR